MTTGNTTLLGLALPVNGELDGTWGDVVNNSITSLLDSAVAGTTTLSADTDVTLTTTTLSANQARQAILLWTASNGATTRNITAPAQSKPYIVINAGTGSVVLRGVGPTTGVTIISGEKCLAAWNGSDFVKVASTAISNLTGTVAIANGGTGETTRQAALDALAGAVTSGQYLRGNGTDVVMSAIQVADVPTLNQNTTGTASNVTGTVAIANGGTGATTRQDAIDALAGAVTSGQYLRGNGTDVVMSAIQAADVPTLNQNTTGSAATLTTGRTIAITGDLAYTSPSFDGSANVTAAGTLATVNSNVGSFTNASVTVNAKGLVTAASSGTAPVTSVTGTSPVASSGGATPAISLASGYGDTQNPYASKTANFVLAAPNGTAGVPTFRAVVAADIPTLNQNTTGTAANVTGTVAIANGGTGETTRQNAMNALAGTQTANRVLRSNGTNTTLSQVALATDVTGTLPVANGGTGVTTSTGTGNVVLSNSPTLVTPALGTPASGTLTNCTVDGSNTVGFRGVPSAGAAKTSNYTLATTDIGEFVEVGSGGSITIPNATFSAGAAVSIFNNTSGGITITCTIATAYKAGIDADQASVTLQTRGVCTVLFISGTVCVISGNLA